MNGKELDLSKIADLIAKTADSARDKLENQSDKMYNVGEDAISAIGEGALSGAKSAAKNIEAAGDIITAKYQKVLDEINRSGKKKSDISSLFATITQIKRSDLNSFNALKDELKDIKAMFTDVGEVKGLDAILKQYEKLLELDEVKLEFDDAALNAIADKAMEKKTGARALRSIIEDYMLDIMYEIPKDNNIGKVVITGDYILKKGAPVIQMRGYETPLIESHE